MVGNHISSYSPEGVQKLLMKYETDSLSNKLESYQNFPPSAKKLLEIIGDILNNCMFAMKGESTENEKYEVYRTLNKVLRFLSNMKSRNVYALLKFKHATGNLCDILKNILRKLQVYLHTFHELVSGFKTADCVYSYSHEMVYSQIGHRIKILLNIFQKYWPPISSWKPTEALYMRTFWMGLIISTDEDIVITREQIGTIHLKDVHDKNSDFMSSAMGTKVEAQDKLDWSLKGPIARNCCPATYTIVACKRIVILLEVAKYFQIVVVTLEELKSSNIDYIFLMCNALLTKAREFICELKSHEVCELFTRVYSILDFILSSVVVYKRDEKSIIQISKECTYIMKLSSFFKDKFDHNEEVTYNDYVDILYKYLVLYIKTSDISFPNWPFFFVKYLSSTAIHRAFKPQHVTINDYKHWDAKFKKLVELHSIDPEDPDLCCGICYQALNFTKPRTISVLENCEHAFCIKCLMETVNTSTDRPALKYLRNSFKCPRDDCSAVNGSFTSGEQFRNFLSDVYHFTGDLDESYEEEYVSDSANVFEEEFQFNDYSFDIPDITITPTTPSEREPEPEITNEATRSLPVYGECKPEVTKTETLSLPVEGENKPDVITEASASLSDDGESEV